MAVDYVQLDTACVAGRCGAGEHKRKLGEDSSRTLKEKLEALR